MFLAHQECPALVLEIEPIIIMVQRAKYLRPSFYTLKEASLKLYSLSRTGYNLLMNSSHNKVQVILLFLNEKNLDKSQVCLFQTNKKSGEFWQNVTGSVEGKESFLEAAHRELLEETGIEHLKIIETGIEYKFEDRRNRKVYEKCFLAIFHKLPKITISKEHQDFKWLTVNQISKSDYGFESNYEALNLSLDYIRDKF